VRRREYRIVQKRYAQLLDGLGWQAEPATDARIETLQPIPADLPAELCLFVSFAPHPELKPHVLHHIEHLLKAGIGVALVLNTSLTAGQLRIPSELQGRLSGVLVRENKGYDFAAWAHAMSLLPQRQRLQRLYLINDSIVGPINGEHFGRLIERVRASRADIVGLTENPLPQPHMQSFFLVFNSGALRSNFVPKFWSRVWGLPTKELVIDVYETRLTLKAREQGLSTETLFPSLSDDPFSANDTYFRWPQLLECGFPYVKTSVIREFTDDPRIAASVPPKLRASALL
jgi:lipopolysaccharide biosynthesis protein